MPKEYKIPNNLIQFWHDKNILPNPYAKIQENNEKYTLNFKKFFIDDIYMYDFFKNNSYLLEVYKRLKVESIRSDIVRLVMLYEYGGIYMDMSMQLHTNLDDIIDKYKDIVLLQRDDQPRYAKYPQKAHIAAGIIAAVPKSSFIKCCLSHLIDTIVKGHYNHHILFAATKYTNDIYIKYLENKHIDFDMQLLSFKKLKEYHLTHHRLPGLANSWKAYEVDGIFDYKDIEFLQKNYIPLNCSF